MLWIIANTNDSSATVLYVELWFIANRNGSCVSSLEPWFIANMNNNPDFVNFESMKSMNCCKYDCVTFETMICCKHKQQLWLMRHFCSYLLQIWMITRTYVSPLEPWFIANMNKNPDCVNFEAMIECKYEWQLWFMCHLWSYDLL